MMIEYLIIPFLISLGLIFFFVRKKNKKKKSETIPPSSNIPKGIEWVGDTAHKSWSERGDLFFRVEKDADLNSEKWVRICKIVEDVRKRHAYSANGVQGDWWGEYGFDCKAYALTFKRSALSYFPEGSVRLATCKAGNFYHAVCLVFTNKGVYALDNRFSKPIPWEELGYTEWAVEGPNGTWNIIGANRPLRGE